MLRLHDGYEKAREHGLSAKIDEKYPQLANAPKGCKRVTDIVQKKDRPDVFRLICEVLGSQKGNAKFARRKATTV